MSRLITIWSHLPRFLNGAPKGRHFSLEGTVYVSRKQLHYDAYQLINILSSLTETVSEWPGGLLDISLGGKVRRGLLTLFKTNIADFPTLFNTEFRFLMPCLSQRKSILINIRACKNFAFYRPRKDILFKTKIDRSIPWLRQKMINLIPCLRQKSRKTYPGWPHVPIKPL